MRHLQRLGPLCRHSQQLLLQLGPDAPLSAAFALRHGGAVQLFVAPVLGEEEEAGEAGEGQQEEGVRVDEEAPGDEGDDVEDAEAQAVRPKARAKAPQKERKKPAAKMPERAREAEGQQRQRGQEDMGLRDQVLGGSNGGDERVVKRRAVADGQPAADKQASIRKANAVGFPAAPPTVSSQQAAPGHAYALLQAPEMQAMACAGGSGALGSATRSAATGAAASCFAARPTPPSAGRSVGCGVSAVPEAPGASGTGLIAADQQQHPSTTSTPATRVGAIIGKEAAVAEGDGSGYVAAGGEGRRRSGASDWGLGAGAWGWEAGVSAGETSWYSDDEGADGGEGAPGQEDELWLASAGY